MTLPLTLGFPLLTKRGIFYIQIAEAIASPTVVSSSTRLAKDSFGTTPADQNNSLAEPKQPL